MFERAKKSGDAVLIGNMEMELKESKLEHDSLDIFRKELGSFVRYYEFMSQIVEYGDTDLEKLSIYAKNLRPMLRTFIIDEDEIDLDGLFLSHYRLSKIRQNDLELKKNSNNELDSSGGPGASKPNPKKEEFISQIISKLNEIFAGEGLTEEDMLQRANTDFYKVKENKDVMMQIKNNTREQAMLGEFPRAVEDAIMKNGEISSKLDMILLSNPAKLKAYTWMLLDMIKSEGLMERA